MVYCNYCVDLSFISNIESVVFVIKNTVQLSVACCDKKQEESDSPQIGRGKTFENSVTCQHQAKMIDVEKYLQPSDLVVKIIERQIEERKLNIKGAPVIVAGGYGMGSKEGFQLCYDLAEVLGGEVGASRAAVDAGFCEHERQIGQTGVTVRPKLYIACGISGQIQHTAGMDGSAMIVSINTDPEAPINKIADYAIVGSVEEVIPKMIKYYKQNSK